MTQTGVKKQGEIDGASKSEDHYVELLPDILDDIMLDVIAPMLSWTDLFRLVATSSVWQQAIQDRLVYDARVRSQKTQKLFFVLIFKFVRELVVGKESFWLYSPSERRGWYELPRIVGFGNVSLSCTQSVSLNGSFYVLGVTKGALDETVSSELYVLDLARLPVQSKWRQCASMQELRFGFALGVMDGKIFAFGGASDGSATGRCEVYNPEVDAWSRIEPMTTGMGFLPFSPKVVAVGKELFVYDLIWVGELDSVHAMDILEGFREEISDVDEENQRDYLSELENELNNLGELDEGIERKKIWDRVKGANFVQAYDPVNNTWRAVDRLEIDSFDPARLTKPKHYINIGDDTDAIAWTISL